MGVSEADAERIDVAIAGGGYVGLSLALALKQADPSMSVAVIDPKPMDTLGKDPRASAIAAAACRMLDQLGIWQDIKAKAQPINEMIVTDSRLRDAVRPVYLTFAGDRQAGKPLPIWCRMASCFRRCMRPPRRWASCSMPPIPPGTSARLLTGLKFTRPPARPCRPGCWLPLTG